MFPVLYDIPERMRERDPVMAALVPVVNQLLWRLGVYLERPDRNRRTSLLLIAHLVNNLDSLYTTSVRGHSEEIRQWCFINAIKLSRIFEILTGLPEFILLTPEIRGAVDQLINAMREPHRHFLGAFSESIDQAARDYQLHCSKIMAGFSVVATGLSALSIFKPMLPCFLITGATACVFGASTASVALFSYHVARERAQENAIAAIYRNFDVEYRG